MTNDTPPVSPQRLGSGQLGTIRRLLGEAIGPRVRRYVEAIACMLVAAFATAALAWLMRHVVNDVLVSRDLSVMWFVAGGVLAVSVIKGLADYRQTVLLAVMGNDVVVDLQRRLFDKVLTLGVDDLARAHSAKLINRLITHANAARNVMIRVSTSAGRDLLTVILLVGVMIAQDVTMGLAALLVGPMALLGLRRIMRRIRELSGREQQSMAGVVQSLQETVQGMRVVKSYTAEATMRERFDHAAQDTRERADNLVRIRAWTSPLMEGLGGALIAFLILFSGWQAVALDKTPGEFMAFILAFLLAYEPAKRLANAHVLLQRDIVGVEAMYEFLDRDEAEPEFDTRPDLVAPAGRVAFSNVVFGYSPGRVVLDDVSFVAEPGQTIALVGVSGAGKSTVAALLQGFYQPWTGEITIDGTRISTVSRTSLRRSIAVVSQDGAVFAGTIRQNIALGRPGASDAEIEAAAEAAFALGFIRALPLGLDTPVGERGSTLSGGQLQRIAIARAILKNAPILVLDEATSALDALSERQVQAALQALKAGRTTLIIAHRPSTIEAADHVYLLSEGKLLAGGTHGEMLAASAQYHQLFGNSHAPTPLRGDAAE